MKKIFRTVAFILALGSMSLGYTACTEDEDGEDIIGGNGAGSVDESVKASNIVAVVGKDGKITIEGDIVANTKIQTFGLSASPDGKDVEIADFTKSESWNQIKNKMEDGKEWPASFSGVSAEITYPCYLVIKTRGGKVIHEQITEKKTLKVGTKDNNDLGSYVSIKKQAVYLMNEISEGTAGKRTPLAAAKDVEVVLFGSGADASFEVANTSNIVANNDGMKGAFQKCYINNGVIVAEDGCAAVFTAEQNASEANTVNITFTVIGLENSTVKAKPASDITLSKSAEYCGWVRKASIGK